MTIPATITPTDLATAHSTGTGVVVDVRSAGEYARVHLDGSLLVPLDRFAASALPAAADGAPRTIWLLCGSGVRARQAAGRLAGDPRFTPVVVEGGINAWIAAGQPVVRGRGAISLERQVRIAAGSLVAGGVALGWWVHPAFFALAASVGLGLVFAGVTDTCGLGFVLARLPWNRQPHAASAPAPAATG